MSIFVWKGVVFSPSCKASKLKISWYHPVINKENHEYFSDSHSEEEDHVVIGSSDDDRDGDSNLENIFSNKNKGNHSTLSRTNRDESNVNGHWRSYEPGFTEIDLSHFGHNNGEIKIIANGYSFDLVCFVRVPVFLVLMEDETLTSKNVCQRNPGKNKVCGKKRLLLLGLSEYMKPTTKSSVTKSMENDTKSNCDLDSKHKLSYVFVPLRTFILRDEFISRLPLEENVVFVSNYGFFTVNTQSASLSLYFGTPLQIRNEDTHIEFEHFSCRSETTSKASTILLYNVFRFFENNSFVLIVLLGDDSDEDSHSCAAFHLSQRNSLSNKFEFKRLQVNKFFPEEYSQILVSFTISSIGLNRQRGSAEVSASSVVMISKTGFAILFANGTMTHCISLSCNFDHLVLNKNASVISIDRKSEHHAAVCINNLCNIIDWSKKKVTSSHSNVYLMDMYGYQHILLLLSPKFHQANQGVSVSELIPMVIDFAEAGSEGVEEERQSTSILDRHESTRQPKEDNHEYSTTHNVLENLINQEKQCELDLMEIETNVERQEIFIENMQKMFSRDLTLQNTSNMRNQYLQPLVPLIGESTNQKQEKDLMNSLKDLLKFGLIWKRTIDFLLICGMQITNISKAHHIKEMNLMLLPINPIASRIKCGSKMCDTSSSISHPLDSPVRKKICLEDEEEDNDKLSKRILKNGKSICLTAYTDVEKVLGGENVTFKILLTCVLHDVEESNSGKEMEMQNVSCGYFTLSMNDIISESFSIKQRLMGDDGVELNKEDIIALDCIQKCYDLNIKSVMNSVLSLKSGLKLSPLVGSITWADQWIIKMDHILRYCRIKWLIQKTKHEARLKVYARNHNDVIQLVQFLCNLVPKDVTISLSHGFCQPSVPAVKTICHSLINRVDDSILRMEKEISFAEQNPNFEMEKVGETSATGTSSSAHGDIAMTNDNVLALNICDEKDNGEVFESCQKSPTFRSSKSKSRQNFRKHQASGFPVTGPSSDFSVDSAKTNLPSFSDHSNVIGAGSSLSHIETVDSMLHDKIKSKGKKGKGGVSKGKGKLMIKK